MLCKTLTPPVHRNASPAQQLGLSMNSNLTALPALPLKVLWPVAFCFWVAVLLRFAIAGQIVHPPPAVPPCKNFMKQSLIIKVSGQVAVNFSIHNHFSPLILRRFLRVGGHLTDTTDCTSSGNVYFHYRFSDLSLMNQHLPVCRIGAMHFGNFPRGLASGNSLTCSPRFPRMEPSAISK